jgi:hypothetical protein
MKESPFYLFIVVLGIEPRALCLHSCHLSYVSTLLFLRQGLNTTFAWAGFKISNFMLQPSSAEITDVE